ncbi:Pol polyprotein [Cyphomyrmex costatus]|uniref:Pol polyprotein n=1 Tax=Cyphomyrmex costatus TaxID=456900 RepID=A0A151IC36_9HYME|nr:Pol polyprotein [Cyphomyrmex costatus]
MNKGSAPLSVFQWNCRGLMGNLSQVQSLLSQQDLVCLQETLLKPDSTFNSSGHAQLRADITSAGDRGVAMLIRNSLRFDPVDLSAFSHPSWEIQGAAFTTRDSSTLVIFNVYRHCNVATPAQVIRALLTFSSSFNHALIVGDLNAHYTSWFCDLSDTVGHALFEELDRVNYSILNEDLPTLIQPPGKRKSVIDLAIVSSALALIAHFFTEEDPMGSDHYRVCTIVGCSHMEISHPSSFVWKERIQYKIIRQALGYRISTPINVLLYEAKKCPLKQRFNRLTASFLFKCWSGFNNLIKEGIMDMERNLDTVNKKIKAINSSPSFNRYAIHHEDLYKIYHSETSPEFACDFETMIHEPFCSYDLCSVRKDSPNELFISEFKCKTAEFIACSDIAIYTDGSKIGEDGPVGAAVYSSKEDFRLARKLPTNFSVFSAEAWAIGEALKLILDRGANSAIVFTDSKSVLEAISSHYHSQPNYIIHQVKSLLMRLNRERKVIVLFWIPSHKGILGNEVVDGLANSAARSEDLPEDLAIPFTDARKIVSDHAKRTFTGWLTNAARFKGTKHAELYQNSSPQPWFYSKSLEREEILLVNRIRSNHYNLNESLFRKGMTASAACHCGFECQDVNHIIFDCPKSRNKSEHLLNFLFNKYPRSIPNDIFLLLKKPSAGLCRRLLDFFKLLDVRLWLRSSCHYECFEAFD